MKKKIIAIILGLILCLSVTACSGDSYSTVKVEGAQDTSYAVVGNGGNAVQYGNYVYFVNGYRGGYDDTDGTANVWGNVVKGALYRAELKGEREAGELYSTFVIKRDEATGNDFVTGKTLDLDQNAVDAVSVQVIAPKTIGTSGFAGGGIFIFDDYVYYASPNNQKDKGGTVQSSKTDFFRTKLDGSKTQKLFTTSADTADKPYGFYKYKGNMYLVVLDGTSLKSIKIGARKCEVTEIASEVENAVFPIKNVYYNGISENGVEDFVYISRTAGRDDNQRAGSVLEALRPDGSERGIFWEDGTTASIDGVRDGLVFFRSVIGSTDTAIRYSNLHDFFMSEVTEGEYMFPSYAGSAEAAARSAEGGEGNVEGIALHETTATITAYTYLYAMRPDMRSNSVYIVAANSAGIWLFAGNNRRQVYVGGATVKLIDGNYVYFTESEGSIVYRTNVFTAADDKYDDEKKEPVTGETVFNGTGLDVCAGYLVYFANIDDNYTNYAHFYELNGLVGREPLFIGRKAATDAPSATDDDNADSDTETAE